MWFTGKPLLNPLLTELNTFHLNRKQLLALAEALGEGARVGKVAAGPIAPTVLVPAVQGSVLNLHPRPRQPQWRQQEAQGEGRGACGPRKEGGRGRRTSGHCVPHG